MNLVFFPCHIRDGVIEIYAYGIFEVKRLGVQ